MATGTGSPSLVRATLRLERAAGLDHVVRRLDPAVRRLVSDPARKRLLQGHVLGHAVHPVLTDYPYGAWVSALVLDLTGGRGARDAATRLVGFGVLSAVPTALTGWAEWSEADRTTKRVGVVHAVVNAGAVVLYTASWVARRRGAHTRGVGLGMAGGLATLVGGYLGGHMSLARKYATNDPAFEVRPGT